MTAVAGGDRPLGGTVVPRWVQLLNFDRCPNWRLTAARLGMLAAEVGCKVEHALVEPKEDAERWAFRGSTSVLIDGRDPLASADAAGGLVCRIRSPESSRRGSRHGNSSGGSQGSQIVNKGSSQVGTDRAQVFRDQVEPEIPVMLRVALSLTGNRADAEDLVQESLVRAFRALDSFDGRHPRAWLLTIVRNTNVNLHRRQRPGLVEDWDLVRSSRPAFGAQTQASPEDIVLDSVLDERLAEAVAELDPRFRAALILVDVQDLSYAEAAAVLGVPVGTVMSRVSRARDRLRRRLGPQLLTPGGTS